MSWSQRPLLVQGGVPGRLPFLLFYAATGKWMQANSDLAAVDAAYQAEFFPKDENGKALQRWELGKRLDKDSEVRKALVPLLEALGMLSPITKLPEEYREPNALGIFGSGALGVVKRMRHVLSLVIRPESRWLLGGARPTDSSPGKQDDLVGAIEKEIAVAGWYEEWLVSGWREILSQWPFSTETELLKAAYQVILRWEFPHLSLLPEIVDAPMRPDGTRPTTEDTLDLFKAKVPSPAQVVFVSHSFFVWKQEITARWAMPQYDVCVVGSTVPENFPLSVAMRDVAAMIHEAKEKGFDL